MNRVRWKIVAWLLLLLAVVVAFWAAPMARWLAEHHHTTVADSLATLAESSFLPTRPIAAPESETELPFSSPAQVLQTTTTHDVAFSFRSLTSDERLELDAIAPMVAIPGGTFRMGSDLGDVADQRPSHEVTLAPFSIDQHEVTNRQFRMFVRAIGFQTDAERRGWSFVFNTEKHGWARVVGACWWNPRGHNPSGGPESPAVSGTLDFPVVHVSWDDAMRFAQWAGKKLPTESQWEYAARGGLIDAAYPWGNELAPASREQCNYWQGWFPKDNLASDGFVALAPRGSFPPHGYGLFDMAGNAAEWCRDLYRSDFYTVSPLRNPQGPSDPDGSATAATVMTVLRTPSGDYQAHDEYAVEKTFKRVVRGGSFLSAKNRDQAYRTFHRTWQPQTLSYDDIGFRCVREVMPSP